MTFTELSIGDYFNFNFYKNNFNETNIKINDMEYCIIQSDIPNMAGTILKCRDINRTVNYVTSINFDYGYAMDTYKESIVTLDWLNNQTSTIETIPLHDIIGVWSSASNYSQLTIYIKIDNNKFICLHDSTNTKNIGGCYILDNIFYYRTMVLKQLHLLETENL